VVRAVVESRHHIIQLVFRWLRYIFSVPLRLFPHMRSWWIFLVVCGIGTFGRAQEPPPAAEPGPAPIAEAVRVEHAPLLNGTLDDPLWRKATPIRNFRQREPYEGQPATEITEVRVLYSKSEVYFGIACHDSGPRGPSATQLRRDVSQELDDYFEIIIDSRLDHRNAYVFQINPLGTQRDALITDEQAGDSQDGDPGWDGVWTSEARITRNGWTATVAIPFSTLNFMRSHDVVWGINFKRFIRRKNEEDLWSSWRRTLGANRISQAGELHGINDIDSGRLFIVKPYLLGGFSHLPMNATSSGLTPGTTALHSAGVDVKVGLRSNLVANLTANTDFADSDVDVQQFNLTPYRIFYPEKRQFFLENAGVFAFPMGLGDSADQLFFSRQIGIDPVTGQQVPVNGGAKVTGNLDGFEVGAMDVDTRSSGPNPWANFAVLRVKKSLWGSGSYVGVMGIDKRSGDVLSSYNQTVGVDGRFVLFKDLVLAGYAAQTRTPGFTGGQTNLGASAVFRSNWFDFEAEHRRVGPWFNPQVGFLERTDCLCDLVDATFKRRPHFAGIRELQFEGFLFHAPDTHHVVQTQEWQATFRLEFQNGSYSDDDIVDVFAQRLTTPFNIYKNVNLPVGVYTWSRHQVTYETAQDRRWTAQLYERFGSYYNGRLNELRVRAGYRANQRLSFSTGPRWNRFRLPVNGGNFSVVVGAFETDYAFSRFLSLSTIMQVNTANAQGASANVRLRWNYRPDSDLYVIYTAGQKFASLAAANPAQFYENRFVVKYTYSFRR
jgi:hypothetical protein